MVGEGVDRDTGESVSFVVPPSVRLRVLADAHAGRRCVLWLHSVDVVPCQPILGVEWDESPAEP